MGHIKMTPPKVYPNFEGLEYLTASVIICDAKFLVLYINPSTEALLEISNDQACHQSIENFLDDVKFFKHAVIIYLFLSRHEMIKIV